MQLSAVYVMVALTGVGFGIANPLVPLLLAQSQATATQVGLAATLLFVAMAGAALAWGQVADRFGPKPGLVVGAAVYAATLVLLPLAGGYEQFLVIRAVEGGTIGVLTVCLEAAINLLVADSRRGKAMGTYTLVFASGVATGPVLAALLGDNLSLSFWVAAAITGLAGLFMLVAFRNVVAERPAGPLAYDGLFGRVWGPVLAALCYALVEVTMLSLYPLYLAGLGLPTQQVSLLFALYAGGAIVSPLVVGTLSDRLRREWVMVGCGLLLVAGTSLLWLSRGPGWLIGATALMGVAAGGIYPTGLSLIGDRVPTGRLGAANSLFTSAYATGSVIGPFSVGLVMDQYGAGFLFAPLLAVAVAFVGLMVADAGQVRLRAASRLA